MSKTKQDPAADAAQLPAEQNMLTAAKLRDKLLLPYQVEWVEAARHARFLCGIWARQTGKSFTTAFIVACSLVMNPKIEWMIAAPSERQSIESLAKVKDWLRALQVVFGEYVEALNDTKETAHGVKLSNGSRVTAVPGRPDTVRGFSACVWMDEMSFFDDPDATWKAILPSITNPLRGGQKRIIITSTPNGKTGRGKRFYRICSKPEGKRMSWTVLKNPLKRAISCGLPVDYDELAEAIDDPLATAQELDCEFLDGSNVLLPLDLITAAESAEATLCADADLLTPGHGRSLYLGIDFGRTNDPTVCWMLERVGDVLVTREVLVLRNMDSPAQEAALSRRIAVAAAVSYDYTGPGIGLGDYLGKTFGLYDPAAHKFGKLELCTFTTPFKRELFPRLRRCFEAPVTVRIPADDAVREDLHQMQQLVSGGEYTYAAPHTAEGHSDRCTALALAVRAAEHGKGKMQFGSLGGVKLGATRTMRAVGGSRYNNRLQGVLRKIGFNR